MATLLVNDTSASFGFFGYFDKISTANRRKWWYNPDTHWMGVINGSGASMNVFFGASAPFWVSVDGSDNFSPSPTGGSITLFTGLEDKPHIVQIGLNSAYSGTGNASTPTDGNSIPYIFAISGYSPSISAYSNNVTQINASGSLIKWYSAEHAIDLTNSNIQPRIKRFSTTTTTNDITSQWISGKSYVMGDIVIGGGVSPYTSRFYNCWEPHISSSDFIADLTGSGYWQQRTGQYEPGVNIVFEAKTKEIWLYIDDGTVGLSIDNGSMNTFSLSASSINSGKKMWRLIANNLDETNFHRYYISSQSKSLGLFENNGVMLSFDSIIRPISEPLRIGQFGASQTEGVGTPIGKPSTDYIRAASLMGCLGSSYGVAGNTSRQLNKQMYYCDRFKQFPDVCIFGITFNNTLFTTSARSRTDNVVRLKVYGTLFFITPDDKPYINESITLTDMDDVSFNGNWIITGITGNGTSNSSNTIGFGNKIFNIQQNLDIDHNEIIMFRNNSTNYMYGPVQSYNSLTGDITANITNFTGSGTKTSWSVGGGVITFNCSGDNSPKTIITSGCFLPNYKECIDVALNKNAKIIIVRPVFPTPSGGDPGFKNNQKAKVALQLITSIDNPKVKYVDTTNWVGIPTSEGIYPWGVGGSGSPGTHFNDAGYKLLAEYYCINQYPRLIRQKPILLPRIKKNKLF